MVGSLAEGSPGRIFIVQMEGLVRAGLRSFWNSRWHSGPGRRLATVLGPMVGILIWAAATPTVVTLLRSYHLGATGALRGGLDTLMVVLVAFTLASSVSFALASIYFARDVEWLLLTPISTRLFLSYRLLSQFALGAMIGTVVAGPAVLAAALVWRSPGLVPLVALVMAALLLVPMSLGLLAVVGLVRVVPASRVKEAVGLLVALVGFGVAAVDLGASVGGRVTAGIGLGGFGHGLSIPAWLPPAWAARSILDAARGSWAGSLLWALALLALATVVTGASMWLAGPMMLEGWFRSQAGSRRRSRARARWLRLPVGLAVARKDWRTLRRDPGQLIQLLLPIGLFAVYLLSPRGGGSGPGLFRNFPSWYGPLTTAAFAALFAVSGLGLRAVGSEGGHFWCLRTAPVSLRALLLSKLLLPTAIAVGASLALMVTTEVRTGTPLGQIAFSSVLLVICVLGLSSLATGMGAVWPRLDWTDPRRAVGIWLAVLFMMVGAGYIAICVVGLTLALLISGQPSVWSELLALLTTALLAGTTAWVALRQGHRRLLALDV
ncbi:MAG: putative ABC transporter permease subunit [Candidatus Dormibacteria bacterium]